MKLVDKLKDLNITLFGNRVTQLGRALTLAGAITIASFYTPPEPQEVYQYLANNHFSKITDPNTRKVYTPKIQSLEEISKNLNENIPTLLGSLALLCGISIEIGTLAGVSTKKYYDKTLKHINLRGELTQEFVTTIINGSDNRWTWGYCQLQGVYLAAKQSGELDTFYKVMKEHSKNLIPNF
ncbi:hypothetical protein GOV12_03885 [Candidatus Pacearchaeota archaeon]|nr:hypothetical protein [Candidatus Pacearchaeota archaeon]